jgi:hypothetical protein
MMVLLGLVTLAATEARARGQSRMMMPSSSRPLQQMNIMGTPFRSSFMTGGVGRNPLAARNAFGITGASMTPLANAIADAGILANTTGASLASSGYGTPSSASTVDPNADQINAQGQIMVNQQQAFYAREKVRSEKIDNQRKAFDEYLYEREKTPTAEDERQLLATQQVRRARNNPSVSEIWSGLALNELLKDLARPAGKKESAELRTQPILLDQDGLKSINLTRGTGNIALLKNKGRLSWPEALSGSESRAEREQLSGLAQEAVKQAEFSGEVSGEITRQMSRLVDRMRLELRNDAKTLPSALYTEATGFLNNLDSAITALKQPDVRNHFAGRYVLQARTVPELVKFMSEQRLQFAPALPEDRTAYEILHRALATYDSSPLVQTTAR